MTKTFTKHTSSIWLGTVLLLQFGCRTTAGDSDVAQLRPPQGTTSGVTAFACYYDQARIDYVKKSGVTNFLFYQGQNFSAPSSYDQVIATNGANSFVGQQLDKFVRELSRLPEPYLQYLIQRAQPPANQGSNFRMYIYDFIPPPPGWPYAADRVGALTTGGQYDLQLQKIDFKISDVVPTVHEAGHAVEGLVRYWAGLPQYPWGTSRTDVDQVADVLDRELFRIRNTAQSSDFLNLRSNPWYPVRNIVEHFAEMFDTYYCSGASIDDMMRNFPDTYAVARAYLFTPPYSDDDGDGIPNWKDKCTNTPKGAKLSADPAKLGCADGQFDDSGYLFAHQQRGTGDVDQDGVTNAEDWCTNTPKGAKVHPKGHEFAGCATGQFPNHWALTLSNPAKRQKMAPDVL